jgi:AbrB family looped-hinge helix DNA binding protein
MLAVTVSPKFQVVIPKEVREAMRVRPGQRLQIVAFDGRIELLPILPPEAIRGMCPGIPTDVDRADRELP